jgi:hypothetical protein
MKTCGMFDDDQPDKFFWAAVSSACGWRGGIIITQATHTEGWGGEVIIFLYHDPYNFES